MRKRTGVAIAVAAATVASSVTGLLVAHRERPPTQNIYAPRPSHFYEVPETQRFRYQTTRAGADTWGRPYHLDNAIGRLRHAMMPYVGSGFQLQDPDLDKEWDKNGKLGAILNYLKHHIKRGPPYGTWKVRPRSHKVFVWRMRKTDIDPAVKADTEGTTSIDIIVGSTLKRFPAIDLLGIYNCRYILGTTTLSQHAYGNAVDWGGSTALLDRVTDWQYMMYKKGWLPMAQLIWQGRDWISGGSVYDHYDHIHDTGKPELSGSCSRLDAYSAQRPIPTVTSVPFEGAENGE